MQKLIEALAVTAEIMQAELSPNAAVIMADDLSQYDADLVFQALTRFRKESNKFSLAGIIAQIEKINPNRRITADEAWALYPHDEYASAVITDEIAEAMGIAQASLNEGDKNGARMAFKSAYERITENNKSKGIEPKWFPSLGTDATQREQALKEGVRLGRLPEKSLLMIPPPINNDFTNGVMAIIETMAIEHKTPEQIENAKAKIAQIKLMLKGNL